MSILERAPGNANFYEYHPPAEGQPTYVFINALTGNTGAWEGEIGPKLRAAGIGTLAWNFRGQVDSPFTPDVTLGQETITGDLMALIEELKPPRPILCGLSIGGLYAADAALKGSDVAGIVLLNTLRKPGLRLEWLNEGAFRGARTGGFQLMMDMMFPLITNAEFQKKVRPNFLTDAPYEPLDPAHGHYKLMEASTDADWNVPWDKLDLPVLSITGHQDRVFYVKEDVDALFAMLPKGIREDWQDCGHLVPLEHPDRLAESLIRFAGQV